MKSKSIRFTAEELKLLRNILDDFKENIDEWSFAERSRFLNIHRKVDEAFWAVVKNE